ncbi:3D domain-containing protein [Paenibacillus sacheonensis]|uniref:LysM peptidoglycan-binding domain-containing protein n=1 Tax=Paenibacillus sacheonensis TaxID=742054 RepID=A0A7X4YNW7_9BACL|nr:3D domain-containing protein [Paenibacillus sacheonensis]MBM7567395.1 3D (Asp-Asp-Asp) domain-containing protein [Paenibacillus sacheonensis]NBC69823.1 LysM peptidoglycan-binding domain-containing protein [Paenibacillus sacheonensis]
MNNTWKKGIAAAVLGIAILSQSGAVKAQGLYKANEDDTFWKLSGKFGITISELMQANPFVDEGNIYEGLQLVIPPTVETAAATASGEPAVKLMKASAGANLAAAAMSVAKAAPKAAAEAPKAAKSKAAAPKKAAKKPVAKAVPKKSPAAATAKKSKSATAKKPQLNRVSVKGKSYVYTDVVQAKASAYTAAPEENGWGAVDYFGNPLKLGTIAVDPDVIPMGSKVYVTGYDFNGLPSGGMIAVASDQGSAINGNRIDIFVPQSRKDASSFGFQYVKVFILD